MAITATYRPSGLFTDPNPHSEVPEGALNQAVNVVHRRRGLLEPRPGFNEYTPATVTAEGQELFEYDGDVLIAFIDQPISGNNWILEWRSDQSVVTTPPDFNQGAMFAAETRGNLYLNGKDDVYKLEAAQQTTTPTRTGLDGPTALEFVSSAAGDGIAANKDVRYRATNNREDSNGVILESAPSHALIVENNTGSGIKATIRIALATDAVAGDTIRLYKSEEVANGSTPSEELQLSKQFVLTSTEITNGYVDIVDGTTTGDRLATMYAAPSRGGLTVSNYRPPVAGDIALFKRSLFFGDTRQPHQITLTYTAKSDRTGSATGIGQRTVSGTATSGNPTMTAVGSTTGVQVGMIYNNLGGGFFPNASVVTAVTASTITFDQNATGSGAETGICIDSIEIDGITYANNVPNTFVVAVNIGVDAVSGDPLNDNGGIPDPNVYATSLLDTRDGTSGGPTTEYPARLAIIRRDGADTSFEIKATHGGEYTPAVPSPTASPGLESTAETRVNAVYWSKDSQPEHVPLLNFVEIGDGSAIQRIVPTRDAMWVFKEDGIYRLTGNGAGPPATWRVDEWDLSHYLAAKKTPAVLDDVVYAWTNRGVIAVSDAGVVNISEPTIQNLLESDQRTATEATDAANADIFAFAAPITNEYWLSPITGNSQMYVWNTFTQSWTAPRSPAAATAGIYRRATNQFILLEDVDEPLWESKDDTTNFPMGDLEYSITVTVTNGGTDVEITANPDSYSPAVGDCVSFNVEGDLYSYITEVVDSDNFVVTPSFGITGAGAAMTASTGFDVTIEYQWRSPGGPALSKNFYLTTWTFSRFGRIGSVDYEFTTPLDTAANTQTRAITLDPSEFNATTEPYQLRGYVDADHARTTQIRPLLTLRAACGTLLHSGIQLVYTPVGEKVAER